jgi:hypothetical protein
MGAALQSKNLSIWSPLKNAVFHALWLASASLLSGSAVSAREMAATWLMNTLTPSPLLISLMSTVCDFAFLSVHASCWSNGRRIRSKEAALFSESLVGDCGGRPGDRHTVRVRESLPDPWKRFPAGCRLSGRRASMDGGIPEVVIKEDLPSAITLGGLQFNISGVIGPAIGAALLPWLGANAVFAINSACLLILAVSR